MKDETLIGKIKQTIGTVKTDCFAYNPAEGNCKALKELYCRSGACRFYKSKKDKKNDK